MFNVRMSDFTLETCSVASDSGKVLVFVIFVASGSSQSFIGLSEWKRGTEDDAESHFAVSLSVN